MSRKGFGLLAISALLLGCAGSQTASGEDWPTWRHDASRSGASSEQLPAELDSIWARDLPANTPAWPEDPRIGFDAAYEPIVVGQTMYVPSAAEDSVLAVDTGTGETRWRFVADGPVRLAPVAVDGNIYFGADDGCLYCVDASSGELVWKLDLAPSPRRALANDRLASVWPVRGGPVVADGKLYCTTGVWPFEGTFVVTVDLASGTVDRSPSYVDMTLPGKLSPQGHLLVSADRLFIPCGRSLPACLDLESGEFVGLRYDSRGKTDYHVVTAGPWVMHGQRIYNVDERAAAAIAAPRPVVDGNVAYFAEKGIVQAVDLGQPEYGEAKDRRGNPYKTVELSALWQLEVGDVANPPGEDVIERSRWVSDNPVQIGLKSGSRLYGHQGNVLFAVELPDDDRSAELVWKHEIEGQPKSLLSADKRLFVVTSEGTIHCFADAASTIVSNHTPEDTELAASEAATGQARELLEAVKPDGGFAVVFGLEDGSLVEALLAESDLRVIAIDPSAERVASLRERLLAAGHYGWRAHALVGDPLTFNLPPYMANLVTSENLEAAGWSQSAELIARMFHVLRPYGGSVALPLDNVQHTALVETTSSDVDLPGSEVARREDLSLVMRPGGLSGAGQWTHEYGDAANSLMSRDELVRAPLGVLWFGGPSSDGELFYDRHDWGPSMTVTEGRILIQGPKYLTCVDSYTGRIFWKREVDKGVGNGRRGNFVSAGHHLVSTGDSVYLGYPDRCLLLDPATGEEVKVFRFDDENLAWGRIRAWEDLLIAEQFQNTDEHGELPVALVAVDRQTGQERWRTAANFSFPFFAVGSDKVFCFDGVIEKLYQDWRRKGLVPEAAAERYLVALDAATGRELWRQSVDLVVTWLAYSEDLDVVVASNKLGVLAHRGETGQQLWRRDHEAQGFGGHPESVWDKVIVWRDRIIDQRGPGLSYFLETGEPITQRHPITGEPVAWEFTKSGHHCNYAIASPHLLTFRADDAGFYDMLGNGTCRLSGFRAGCRNSLLPADGVLNAPNFAHGCVCGYSLFTSLAFVNVPEVEMWSYSALQAGDSPVRRVGVNLAAPGDRQSESGTLWLDYPSVGGSSPDLAIECDPPRPRWLRRHAHQVNGEGDAWVSASGANGLRRLSIPLGRSENETQTYTVRLQFAELEDHQAGERVFDVVVQGQTVLEQFDIARAAGGQLQSVVREFTGIEAADRLEIALAPVAGEPLLCGVEVVLESQ